jgi:hypothetical protein
MTEPTNYQALARLVSKKRLERYLLTAREDECLAVEWYWRNLKISGELYKLLAVFEVILRNRIDQRGSEVFKMPSGDWLVRLYERGWMGKVSPIRELIRSGQKGSQLVANLPFGFWCGLFSGKQFVMVGSKLIRIFGKQGEPVRPKPIRSQLHRIRLIRNRIAHHEPVVFGQKGGFDLDGVASVVGLVVMILKLMGVECSEMESYTGNLEKVIGSYKKQKPSGVKQ